MNEALIILQKRFWELKKVESDIQAGVVKADSEWVELKLKEVRKGISILNEGISKRNRVERVNP